MIFSQKLIALMVLVLILGLFSAASAFAACNAGAAGCNVITIDIITDKTTYEKGKGEIITVTTTITKSDTNPAATGVQYGVNRVKQARDHVSLDAAGNQTIGNAPAFTDSFTGNTIVRTITQDIDALNLEPGAYTFSAVTRDILPAAVNDAITSDNSANIYITVVKKNTAVAEFPLPFAALIALGVLFIFAVRRH